MELRKSMEPEDVAEWTARDVAHPAGQKVDFHFHEVEEWLEILDGDVTFYSVGGRRFHVNKGMALRIFQGEVHRVEVGPKGVLYRMWLPAEVKPAAFSRGLDREDMDLIVANLELPVLENERDAGRKNATRASITEALLAAFVSAKLSFRTASGETIGKRRYLDRNPSEGRREPEETRSPCVLHRCQECMLISTVVDLHQGEGESASSKSYMNLRLFGREEDNWRCCTWINFQV